MATIICLYDDVADAHAAIVDLISSGIDRKGISLIANTLNRAAGSGRSPLAPPVEAGQTEELVAAARGFTLAGVGQVATEGPIAAVLAEAETGEIGKSLVGALLRMDIHEQAAQRYAEGVRRGGALVVGKVADERTDESNARLREHNPVAIEERARLWRQRGWRGFNEQARPCTRGEIQREMEMIRRRLEEKPGPTFPQGGAGGGVWSGVAPHTDDERQIQEHARAEWLETVQIKSADPEHKTHPNSPYSLYEGDFHNHYNAVYTAAGPFAEFYPAYEFGALLGESAHYMGRDWDGVETEVRAEWEETHPDTWKKYRDAIRYGWGRVRRQRYPGPDRRHQPRAEHRYVW